MANELAHLRQDDFRVNGEGLPDVLCVHCREWKSGAEFFPAEGWVCDDCITPEMVEESAARMQAAMDEVER